MSDQDKPILEAEKVTTEENTSAQDHNRQKKKSRLKFHLLLMLVLGVGTWAFITYAPIVKTWRAQWYDFTHQSKQEPVSTAPVQPGFAPATEEAEVEDEPIEATVDDTPIFEPAPELASPEPVDNQTVESLADLSTLVSQLQQQLATMQDNMNQMYAQQLEFSKQQVSAQLFTELQKAAKSTRPQDAATAWKSISLLPYLDNSRRTQAEQAWQDLQGLSNDIEILKQNIIDTMRTLAETLRPETLAEVAETVDNLVDEYANTDTWETWLDWLAGQFKITKVKPHAVTIVDDPYADIKALINQLDLLQKALTQGQWQGLPDMESLRYQLEQHGMETSISPELIHHIQQTQQQWQAEAKAWMEQL